jgi:hypothetical protein
MSYQLHRISGVVRLSDGCFIWPDPTNCAWQEYLDWVAKGGTPAAADPPPPPSQDEIDAAAAREYAKLAALRGMTPAQVVAWVSANVTNLAQAQDAIATLAVAVSVLSRRL